MGRFGGLARKFSDYPHFCAAPHWEPSARENAHLCPEKSAHVNSRFAENRPECPLRHIARVMRDGDFSASLKMTPDFVTAGSLTIKLEPKGAETAGNLSIREPR